MGDGRGGKRCERIVRRLSDSVSHGRTMAGRQAIGQVASRARSDGRSKRGLAVRYATMDVMMMTEWCVADDSGR
jgi:hypothetical protein